MKKSAIKRMARKLYKKFPNGTFKSFQTEQFRKIEIRGVNSMSKNDDCIVINKKLIKDYGIETAVLISEIASEGQEQERYFEYTVAQLEENTGLSKKQQIKILKQITELGLVEIQIKGIPPKRYFKVNYEKLPDCLKEQAGQAQLPALKTTSKPKAVLNKQEQSDFEQLWSQYPNKQGKQKALMAYKKAIKDGATFDEIMQGIQNYKFYIEQKGIEQEYIKHGSTWFNQRGWEDDYTVIERQPIKKKSRYETVDERNNRVFAEFLKDEDLSDLPQVYEDCLKGLTEGFHV